MTGKGKNGKQSISNPATSRVRGRIPYYTLAISFLAFGVGFLHVYHVSTMFENDKHFSHLSTLEREMSFYTELGLYYSYYKTIVEAQTFLEGIVDIMYDNKTEYPSVINTLQRFNVYPEVAIGLLYRGYMYVTESLNVTTKHCWQVDRGNGFLSVLSCEGLGDPAYFYVEVVWLCTGLTMAVMFLLGHMLSGTIVGGAVCVISFFYNHGECTRVQWAPPMRESFGYPFCILQILAVTKCLHLGSANSVNGRNTSMVRKVLLVWIPTWVFLLVWQFAQFVLTTQLFAVFLLYVLGIIKRNTFLPILYGYAFAVSHAALSLFINEFLIFSFLTATLIAVMIMSMSLTPVLKHISYAFRVALFGILTPMLALGIKSQMNYFSGNKDDVHIVNILKSKLLGYKDFHTLMYTCSPEFDFLSRVYVINISKSLLLPSVLLAILLFAVSSLKVFYNKQGKLEFTNFMAKMRMIDPAVAYNMLQMGAFGIMAILIMRLKLFFTPHLCLMVSLLASPKFSPWRSQEIRLAFIFLLIAGMSVNGVQNLKEQREIIGEFSNGPMEELFNWINMNTKPDAVFAGPMPLMANVLLSTRRPIVNHPHYENANLRARTKNVYSIFSRRTAQEVFVTLSQMKVDYVVIADAWCIEENKNGCSVIDLWDVEEPQNAHRLPVCPTLMQGDPSPFVKVFSNDVYAVLQVHSQSRYVELQSPMLFTQ